MFCYFGYGLNLSPVALRAKGVEPVESEPAMLPDWRLCFNVPDFFAIEGSTGNIEPAPGDVVHGVLHSCPDRDLSVLDKLEALGVRYERHTREVLTYSGRRIEAFVFVGLASKVTAGGLPSLHYRNVLVQGAEHMRLAPQYVERLRNLPVCDRKPRPPFEQRKRRVQYTEDVPSRRVLREAEARNEQFGHENFGFLSSSHGFMPTRPPELKLRSSLHEPWDEAAGELTALYRDLGLRRRLEQLPVLPAVEQSLPDGDLLRACTLLAMMAHAYWYVESKPPQRLPEAIRAPWAEIRRRLGRGPEVLSYVDLIVYNWRLIDPNAPDPLRIDNMRLLVPTVDTNEERIFYLTQSEILARCNPVIDAVVRAQEAVVRDHREQLEGALLDIMRALQRVVRESLPHINPCSASPSYVDPVVWAKTVAPFAVPLEAGVQGPSGTSSPIFNLLDLFFGRTKNESFLGREIKALRQVYPLHWQQFLDAVKEVSISDYVRRIDSPSVTGLLQEAIEMYAGENGFLSRHRMKVYGYLQLAFKVGRSVTIGGFSGMFEDRTWDQVDSELEHARLERLETFPQTSHLAHAKSVPPGLLPDEIRHVVLDVSDCGIRYEPGDRCAILPENDASLVARTIAALHATGDEIITLTPEWREAVRLRAGYSDAQSLSLREVLTFGRIRPVTLRLAEALHAASQNVALRGAILQQTTTRWELWDLLAELEADGFDPTSLWRAPIERSEHLCHVLPPETFRTYSISSTMGADETSASEIHLTVGRIHYQTPAAGKSSALLRHGSASNFLAEVAGRDRPVTFIVRHPPRFGLPSDPRVPIVMLAGGTGIGPFRSFLLERDKHRDAGPAYLFWSLRSRNHFCYSDDLKPSMRAGTLALHLAFTRDDVVVDYDAERDEFDFEEAPRRHIREVLLGGGIPEHIWSLVRPIEQGGQGAHFYICGGSQFAKSVDRALLDIVQRFVGGDLSERTARARAVIERLVADGRYNHEIFTDARAWDTQRDNYDVSEIVRHNDDDNGWWMVIDGRVYDLTEFIRHHPGGARVLEAYAGLDATEGYLHSHAGRSEIAAMRELYEIGTVRRPDFRGISRLITTSAGVQTVALSALHETWVGLLYLIVEMQNALRHDQSLQLATTTRGTPAAIRTPYKLQWAVETHERFMQCYLRNIADELARLWELTSTLCRANINGKWMASQVEALLDGSPAQQVGALTPALYDGVAHLAHSVPRDVGLEQRLVAMCGELEAEDQWFLAEMKRVLRNGVRVFEDYAHEVLERGADRLLACSRETASVLANHYERIFEAAHGATWLVPGGQGAAAERVIEAKSAQLP